jgi:hypothetical protein
MEEIVYELSKDWPKTEKAILVFERLMPLLPFESMTVTDRENFMEIKIQVLPEQEKNVREIGNRIFQRTLP